MNPFWLYMGDLKTVPPNPPTTTTTTRRRRTTPSSPWSVGFAADKKILLSDTRSTPATFFGRTTRTWAREKISDPSLIVLYTGAMRRGRVYFWINASQDRRQWRPPLQSQYLAWSYLHKLLVFWSCARCLNYTKEKQKIKLGRSNRASITFRGGDLWSEEFRYLNGGRTDKFMKCLNDRGK